MKGEEATTSLSVVIRTEKLYDIFLFKAYEKSVCSDTGFVETDLKHNCALMSAAAQLADKFSSLAVIKQTLGF